MRVKFTTTIKQELLQRMKIEAIKRNVNLNVIIEGQFKRYLEERENETRNK